MSAHPLARLRRASAAILAVVGGLLLAASLGADDQEANEANMERLRQMPPERRAQLARSLDEFHKLPGEQRSALRELDARVQDLDPEAKASYLSVLQRYHLWLRTLSPEQRQQIASAGSAEARIARVNAIREKQREALRKDEKKADWIQVSNLNDLSLFWTAYYLNIWFLLDDSERDEIEAISLRDDRLKKLRDFGPKKKAGLQFRHIRDEFRAAIEEVVRAIDAENPNAKIADKIAVKKSSRIGLPKKVNALSRKVEKQFLNDHEPAPVDPQHLAWFEQQSPGWLRESLDPLPPDAARRRLVILYRMVFPPDGPQISAPKPKAAAPKPPSPPTPPPAPKPGNPTGATPL